MATALRPIGHDDRLSLTEHLDELRSRLIVSALAFTVAFGVALWQNDVLLQVVNRPAQQATAHRASGPLSQEAGSQEALRRALESGGLALERLAPSGAPRPPPDR